MGRHEPFARNESELMTRRDDPIGVVTDEYGQPIEWIWDREEDDA